MKSHYMAAALCAAVAFACPAKAATYQAGLPCESQAGTIPTRGSDTMDDLLACVGGYWHSMVYGGMPSSGIAAFNTPQCPPGWVDVPTLAGRTIIGAGAGVGLTSRTVGETGGEETHTQTIAEMAAHDHGVTSSYDDGSFIGWTTGQFITARAPAAYNRQIRTDKAGGGQPFNVMMPWYALHYCMKQ